MGLFQPPGGDGNAYLKINFFHIFFSFREKMPARADEGAVQIADNVKVPKVHKVIRFTL